MVSPFPGMDPYLEEADIWSDLHLTLIIALRAELNRKLPEGYTASADRHVWIEDPDGAPSRRRGPDVFVSEESKKRKSRDGNVAVLQAPRTITLPMGDRKGKPYLRIMDKQARRVVTVLELLSPSNKTAGPDRQSYLGKRQEYFDSRVNLVEINLLRKGKLPPLGDLATKKLQYYFLICRAWDLPRAELWPFTVREPFPDLPVPLRPRQEITVQLRPCLDRAYREARYDRDVDYARPPLASLSSEDAVWAKALLKRHKNGKPRGDA